MAWCTSTSRPDRRGRAGEAARRAYERRFHGRESRGYRRRALGRHDRCRATIRSPQKIEIVGSYPAGATESDDLEPSVPDPALYAGDVLLRALGDAGIIVAGGVRGGVAPRGAEVFWRFESAAMPQLLSEFWLPSDNLMGELFLKELGAARSGEPGSFTNGIAVEGEYLRSIGDRSCHALDHGRLRTLGVRSHHAARPRGDSTERLGGRVPFDRH